MQAANPARIDFKQLNASLAGNGFIKGLFPHARRVGQEWQIGDLSGQPGHSLCINSNTGSWIDNATGQRGRDFISLVAAREGIGQVEAARRLMSQQGLSQQPVSKEKKPAGKNELPEASTSGPPTDTFNYYLPDGRLERTVKRWDAPGCRKAIRQTVHIKDAGPVAFNLDEVQQASSVYVVEGEICVLALAAMGLVSTCNPMGAGKWQPGHADYLKGKDVIILPDNDQPGQNHAQQVAASLVGKAKSVKVVNLPGLPPKGDIVDWVNAGGTPEQLLALVEKTPLYEPDSPQEVAQEETSLLIKSTDLCKIPPPEPIIKGLLNRGGLGVITASYGRGKSFLALDSGLHVAQGEPWWGHKTKVAPLVYVNLEGRMVNRLKAWERVNGPAPEFLVFESGQFNINDEKFLNAFIHNIPRGALVIIDTLAIAACGANLDRAEEVTSLYDKFRRIARETGGAVIVVAHLGKDQKRGASGSHQIEAQADMVIAISDSGNVEATKVRDGERHSLGYLTLEVVSLGFDEDGDEITSCVATLENGQREKIKTMSPALKYALDSFHKARGEADSVELEAWRGVFYAGSTADNTHAKKISFQRARKELVALNIISINNDTYTYNKPSFSEKFDFNLTGTTGTTPAQMNFVPPGAQPAQPAHTFMKGVCRCRCPGL